MMLANLDKKVELVANITIIVVASLFCVVLVKNQLLTQSGTNAKAAVPDQQQATQAAGN